MSSQAIHPECYILCAGCGGEVHASQNDGPADRPFRCRSCRQRHQDMMRMHNPSMSAESKERATNEVTDSDLSDQPAAAKRRAGSNRPAQHESTT
jgi:hypothetical protein